MLLPLFHNFFAGKRASQLFVLLGVAVSELLGLENHHLTIDIISPTNVLTFASCIRFLWRQDGTTRVCSDQSTASFLKGQQPCVLGSERSIIHQNRCNQVITAFDTLLDS